MSDDGNSTDDDDDNDDEEAIAAARDSVTSHLAGGRDSDMAQSADSEMVGLIGIIGPSLASEELVPDVGDTVMGMPAEVGEDGVDMDVVSYTFGSPRVGNHTFAREYDSLVRTASTWDMACTPTTL